MYTHRASRITSQPLLVAGDDTSEERAEVAAFYNLREAIEHGDSSDLDALLEECLLMYCGQDFLEHLDAAPTSDTWEHGA